MEVHVVSTIGALADDLARMPVKVSRELAGVVREGIKVGNTVAKDFARASSGSHGKLYPRAFSTTMQRGGRAYRGFSGAASATYSGEYGPDARMPQGGMSFEYGSRNQKPHLDLARSADLVGPALPGEVRSALDRVFW